MKKILLLLILLFPFSKMYPNDQPYSLEGDYTQKPDTINPCLFGDYLYWKFDSDFIFARTGINSDSNATTSVPFTGTYKNINFHYRPGYRIGVDFFIPHGGWDLLFQYTFYHTKSTRTVRLNPEDGKQSNAWITSSSHTNLLIPQLSFDMDLNQFDVELGRNTHFSEFFWLRPFISFKGVYLNHEVLAKYISVTTRNPIELQTNKTKISSYSPAVGLRGGLNGAFYFTKQFSLVGKIALTGNYFFHKTSSVGKVSQPSVPTYHNKRREYDEDQMALMSEFQLGVKWETTLKNNKSTLSLKLAFEQQIWNQNSIAFDTSSLPTLQAFSLRGMTINGDFCF